MELVNSINQTGESIAGIMNETKELASNVSQVQSIAELVRGQVLEAAKVVSSIQENAKYSNILALNASIESARAGQAGKGFAVVSEEMRKFFKLSSDAAIKINENLVEIEKSQDAVVDNLDHSSKIADEQAVAVNILNELFESVSSKANIVTETCRKSIKS